MSWVTRLDPLGPGHRRPRGEGRLRHPRHVGRASARRGGIPAGHPRRIRGPRVPAGKVGSGVRVLRCPEHAVEHRPSPPPLPGRLRPDQQPRPGLHPVQPDQERHPDRGIPHGQARAPGEDPPAGESPVAGRGGGQRDPVGAVAGTGSDRPAGGHGLGRAHEVEPLPHWRAEVAHPRRATRRRAGDGDRMAVRGPGGQGDRSRHLRPHPPRHDTDSPGCGRHGSRHHGFQTGDLVRAMSRPARRPGSTSGGSWSAPPAPSTSPPGTVASPGSTTGMSVIFSARTATATSPTQKRGTVPRLLPARRAGFHAKVI